MSRFVTEAKAVNQIGHEHIVDIADFGNTPDGEFYFVMEYLQGESLSDRLRRESRARRPPALSIAAQIADALDAAHEQGIIHRDLKPENIFLVQPRPQPRLRQGARLRPREADAVRAEGHATRPRTGSVMGTPYYMSPEQCEGKIEIDHRADIYSLGVLLFEMLTGKVPFGGEGYGEIIVKHVTMPPPSVRSVVPELPAGARPDPLPRAGQGPRSALPDDGGVRARRCSIPQRYAHARRPVIGIPDDLSGVARAASPMARSEMDGAVAASAIGVGAAIGPAARRRPVDVPRGARRADRSPDPARSKSGMLAFYIGRRCSWPSRSS